MSNMRRICVPIPHETDQKIVELRRRDEYLRTTYSGVVRDLIEKGLSVVTQSAQLGQ